MRKSRAVQLNRVDGQDGLAARGGSRGRLLPLLLTLLLLIGSLRPVEALASESGAQESAAQLAIPITVELSGDEGAPPDETYVISVQAESIGRLPEGAYVTEESSEGTTADSLPVTIDEETLTLLVETAEGSFYVGPVTFDEAGGYVYTITQIPGDNPAITYDDTVYYFTVVVTRDADGELVMQAYAFREGLDEKVDEIVFSNVYKEPEEEAEESEPDKTQTSGTSGTSSGGTAEEETQESDTLTEEEETLHPVPELTKLVADEQDGTYKETNTAGIGDTVYFLISFTAQAGAENYIVHDAMDAGLVFNAASLVVAAGDADGAVFLTEGTDYVLNAGTRTAGTSGGEEDGGTSGQTGSTGEETDGCTFEVVFKEDYLDTLTGETDIQISYSAVISEDAVIGDGGNVNLALLQYSDPWLVEEDWPFDETITFVSEPVPEETGDDDNPLRNLLTGDDAQLLLYLLLAAASGAVLLAFFLMRRRKQEEQKGNGGQV